MVINDLFQYTELVETVTVLFLFYFLIALLNIYKTESETLPYLSHDIYII